VDEHGRFRGNAVPTGIRPRFSERFADHGIAFDLDNLVRQGRVG
jgi:pilus assembly protein CpaF